MNKERLIELSTLAIHGLIEDDRESAIEYMHDFMDLAIEELEFFGVELTDDELDEYEWERVCPICGKRYSNFPALSRRDNKTYICSDCGVIEAMSDLLR